MKAARMFDEGRTQAEVARELGVSWRAAHDWHGAWKSGGREALAAGRKPGPAPKFDNGEMARLEIALREGALAHGYDNDLWTLRRVGRLVGDLFGKKVSQSEVWRLLRRMRWSPQKPARKARERNEAAIADWKENQWPRIKAKARSERRTIVFVDESGLTQKPSAKSTWSPQGETPVLELNFNWKKLSVIGGITIRSLYFRLHEDSVKAPK